MQPEASGPEPSEPVQRSGIPRATTILLALAGATVAAFGIAAIQGIFTPVFLALVITVCVHPMRRWMQRHGVPRGIGTGTTIAASFAVLIGLSVVLLAALAQFSALLPQYAPQLNQLGESIAQLLESAGFGSEQAQTVQQALTPGRIIEFVTGLLGNITGMIGVLVIILTMLILMAVDGGRMAALLTHLQPHRPAMATAFSGFAVDLRRYMVATTVLGAAQGLFNWLVLFLLQVPGAMAWGVLSFICSFIPNIGYFIAIIPPLVFGALSGGWPVVVAVIVIYGVINSVIQSIIQPKYIGNAVSLSETLTFVSVLFWAVVLGPVGAILAVPLTLLVRTILLDSDPSKVWRRALTGDKKDIEAALKLEDDAIRARRPRRRPDHPHRDGTQQK
ncbi:AI-2E family transporter [Arthrobacter sp. CAU 1506]|uniref:AI-2E family transporter n=1 Tax=Arthrobacter sp. CAU 1506 TaxID=2560052 RepID=UPI0010AB69E1|nr:AI-2E family transporter [Arthrobacter sp. CAU 1506]TJY71462.1 AI-2E family transporter [Arthrobacter sp. CAU 1506]